MKKLIIPIIVFFLILALVVCYVSNNALNNSSISELLNLSSEHDIANSPEANTNFVYPDEVENILVDIIATNAYVLNIDTYSVIYQKNSDERIAPASTAKLLTALTVIDYYDLDETVTVGSEIDLIAADSSIAGLSSGDKLTIKNLLVALLLPSGNDAAYTLAVNTGKRIADKNNLSLQQAINVFVDAMNQKAKDVGAVSSNFTTPDGYDADGQYTTALDLALIAKICLENDTLIEITGSDKISDTWINGREVTYYNTNKLVDPYSYYYYSGAIGLKTGNSAEAGSCVISAAKINGQTYICVVMGSAGDSRFSDSLIIFSEIDPDISLPKENDTPMIPALPNE